MRYTLFIFLYCIPHVSTAQEPKNYLPYFDKIIAIEDAVGQENFDKAIEIYADLFSAYKRVFARDAFNACQLTALRNNLHFQDFFHRCAQSGIDKDVLTNNPYINISYNINVKALDSLYYAGYKDFLKRVDVSLRREFLDRFALEQANKGKKDYAKICTDNFKRILELANQGRFPGEDIIGVDRDVEISFMLATLLHHPYAYTKLQPHLWKAMEEGKLQPLSILYLYSFNQTRTSILYTEDIPVDTINFNVYYNIPFGKRSDDIAEVNRQRSIRKFSSVEVERNVKAVARKYRLNYLQGY